MCCARQNGSGTRCFYRKTDREGEDRIIHCRSGNTQRCYYWISSLSRCRCYFAASILGSSPPPLSPTSTHTRTRICPDRFRFLYQNKTLAIAAGDAQCSVNIGVHEPGTMLCDKNGKHIGIDGYATFAIVCAESSGWESRNIDCCLVEELWNMDSDEERKQRLKRWWSTTLDSFINTNKKQADDENSLYDDESASNSPTAGD